MCFTVFLSSQACESQACEWSVWVSECAEASHPYLRGTWDYLSGSVIFYSTQISNDVFGYNFKYLLVQSPEWSEEEGKTGGKT